MARDREEIRPAFQLLVYPCLDDRHATLSSHEFAAEGMIWNRQRSVNGWKQYLGAAHRGDPSPYAAPARAEDLTELPPTYVMAAQLDVLRDENIAYAQRLMQAGVPVELHVHPGAMHGFVLLAPAVAISERAISGYVNALDRSLNNAGAGGVT
jgi:acetyl esterase/lipase